MTVEEFAQMSNYNLAESIHNKWLQASGNKGGDLYVAAVYDYIRAFLQVVLTINFSRVALEVMALVKKNSSFDAHNVVPNVLVTPSLVLTMRPTALTPSTSLALVLLREPQGLILHPCLPSSRSYLRLCSRFPHPLPLVWIFAVSLLSKILK